MGCISAKDVQQSINKNIYNNMKQTHIIAFDQLFLLQSQCLRDLDLLQNKVISRRINMINITKAHLLNNPKLTDAYKLWTWGVSLCNKGNSKGMNVHYSFNNPNESVDKTTAFNYNLGSCKELRFHWFAIILKEYVEYVQNAKQQYPEDRLKAKDIYEKLKTMKEQSSIYLNTLSLAERTEAFTNIEYNMSKINKGLFNADQFYNNLKDLDIELEALIQKSYQYESEADQWGRKLYRDLDVIPIGNDSYRMRAKMNSLVLLYHPGKKRTQEEEDYYYNIKLERSKIKPKVLFNDEDDKQKIFLFKIRWTGCSEVDEKWSEIAFILEKHSEQIKSIKQIRNKIRYELQTYKYVDDNLIEAWKIYCLSLLTELKDVKITLNISDQESATKILKNQQVLNENLELQTKLFSEYFFTIRPSQQKKLKEYWRKLDFDKQWIQGSFMKSDQFKMMHHQNQYNMMTNQAKNIYEFTTQNPLYQAIYQKKYLKLEKEAEDLFTKGIAIFEEMERLYEQYKIDKDVDKLMKQELRSNDVILKKQSKLSKYN
ncbi:unnamed protein product (macronuclear) [Paramecium tetraurelia]|uniref:PH domain-containing protein n=1 Tax=Paramecium tetraurelia TaxID=5888 RepID=A0D2P2_PARTE|nr:uncharacterized protein GSPATT00012817001 [Paramecium tetraurelia]CAK77309.1 unnamed protein product [Paramecium tetraurelia]|eukprot:XP_001444706.1 hypothetical protein (macronuclear) [Paramecium tetraurelia strain d4-2]